MPDRIGDQMAGVGPEATRDFGRMRTNSGHSAAAWWMGQICPITDIRRGPTARVGSQLNCGQGNTRLRPELVSGETMPHRFSILSAAPHEG
jgi:hypothetical protein